MPIKPPIKTLKKSGQYITNSFIILSLVNWPKIPDIELTKINKDAVVIIFFGLSAFNKNKIGLKNIPPPIPTIPEINPSKDPMITEIKKLSFFQRY